MKRPLLLLLAIACSASEPTQESALLVVGRGASDAAAAAATSAALLKLAAATPVRLVSGPTLAGRLGGDPAAALAACGADVACLSGIATKASAREVIVGRVGGRSDGGLRVQFLVVPAGAASIDRRVQFDVVSADEIESSMTAQLGRIVGMVLPGAAAPEPATLVARAGAVEGTVRVQRAKSGAWEALRAGSELYAGDVVETGAGATARIDYVSGSSFDVQPKATIALEQAAVQGGGEVVERIAVRSGVVRGRVQEGARRVVVQAPDGETIDLAAARGAREVNFRLSARGARPLEVAVTKGSGVIRARGEARQLDEGRAQEVSAGALLGEVAPLPDFPKLLAPGVDATMHANEDLRVDLRWAEIASAVGYHLQVAIDPSFQKLQIDEVASLPTWQFRPPLQGTYYWRVATRAADGREGEFGFARRLYVSPEQIPELLVSPVDGMTLTFAPRAPRFVTFTWRAAVPPAPYVLMVSKHKEVTKDPVLSITTTSQEVSTRQLEAGEYFWGVFVERSGARKPIFQKPHKLALRDAE